MRNLILKMNSKCKKTLRWAFVHFRLFYWLKKNFHNYNKKSSVGFARILLLAFYLFNYPNATGFLFFIISLTQS